MSAIDRFIEKDIAGKKHKLLKPTRRVRDRLSESAHAWKKERMSHNLRLAGIDGDEMVARLEEFDGRKATMADVIEYVNSVGVMELLELALSDYDEAADIADAVEDPMALACELWGWQMEGVASGTTGDEANPPKPVEGPAQKAA